MAVLITGGAGYIGSHTSVELLKSGVDIIIADNFANSSPVALERIKQITNRDFLFYEVDVQDKAKLNEVFRGNNISAVIHFAGDKAVGESVANPLKYYHNNLLTTINLCECMAENNVWKMVFSSSATVYGNPITSPITEDFALHPESPYGTTKLMGETILRDLSVSDNRWSIAILRYFNPVGANETGLIGEDPNGIPNNLMPFIAKVGAGKLECLSVFGDDYDTIDGTGVRDYIHVVDLSIAHVKALKALESQDGIDYYNIGTGKGYSVFEVISAYEKAIGKTINKKIAPRRDGDVAEYFASPKKAAEKLGFVAEKTLEQMCADTANWQGKNPNGYDN